MKNYLFQMIDGYDVADVENELQKKGLLDSYIIQDDATGETFIGGRSRKKITSRKTLLVEEKSSVNWEDQWALFAEDFKDGKARTSIFPPLALKKHSSLLPVRVLEISLIPQRISCSK